MTRVKVAWVFDLDGVITNLRGKNITEPEILDLIAEKLETGEPIALNTGRSLVWMVDRVVNSLLQRIKNKKNLKKFFASGEKGATWTTFDESGKMQHHKDKSISIPKPLQEKIRNLINSKFSESMFYDETKETMISIEMQDGYPIEKYSEFQKTLNKKLQELVNENHSGKPLKIDPTIIATDLENKHVGKGFAVERILKWLDEKRIKPQKFATFGDSPSDFSMPEKLHEKGKNVEFIYVGKENIDASKYPFPIKITRNKFEKGTLEYLKSL